MVDPFTVVYPHGVFFRPFSRSVSLSRPDRPHSQRDYQVENKGNVTTYQAVAGGIAIKRLLVSTDTEPEGHLITSREEMGELLNGLVGFSRACGARFNLKHQFGYVSPGAGFEDDLYIGGHEDGIFGAVRALSASDISTKFVCMQDLLHVCTCHFFSSCMRGVLSRDRFPYRTQIFALNPASGNTYLIPMPAEVELATPLYAGRTDYVAMAVRARNQPFIFRLP
eukprot:1400148-Pleurochrysis_carterae.AAC.2